MLFSSSLVLLGVLSTVRGHPNHHHHKAIARQFNAPAPPPAAAGASSHSGQPGAPAATQLPPGGSLVGQSAPPATTPSATGPSTTLPDATLTATDPAIPPLSELTSGISSSTPAFTFVPTLGAPGPYPGAPPIPSTTLDRSRYPSPTQFAPTDGPLMAQWLKELEGVEIPDIPPTSGEGTCAENPEAAADPSRCWWTCGGCTSEIDVVSCPDKFTWGLTFDDGPSPQSPRVHEYLQSNNLTATFFLIGSNHYYFSDIAMEAYVHGSQVAAHTWHHGMMTTLDTMTAIAELGYSRDIITQTLGVTPKYWRPPYGDIDERIRAISLGLGMQPIIWTRQPVTMAQFDTNDWKIPGGETTGPQAFQQFETILQNASQLDTGFIVLEHDLYEQTVDLAVGYTLPTALGSTNPKYAIKSVIECMHLDMAEAYNETRTLPMPQFVTSWRGNFTTVEEIVAQSNSSSGTPGLTGPDGTSLPSTKHTGGSLALTASMGHIFLVLVASVLAGVLRS